jgi:hypothetical protein
MLILGACGKQAEAPAGGSGGSGGAPAAAAFAMPEPGEYKHTVEILEMSIPGMPAGMADQFKSQMSAAASSTDCLTAAQSKDALKQFNKGMAKGDCTYSKYDVSGGKLDAVMECTGKDGGKSTFTLNGTFTATGSDVTAVADEHDPRSPGGSMHMKLHMVSQRTGECTAG